MSANTLQDKISLDLMEPVGIEPTSEQPFQRVL